MATVTPQAQIDAAQAYEALMVPALFGQWAAMLSDLAGLRAPMRVLDVACGTGVLARHAAARLDDPRLVAGIDPNPGMLEVARRLAPSIEWRQAAAESLPFAEASFDAVLSQFGLMFFGDRRQALHEMHRVLRREGIVAAAVWDALERNRVYAVEVEIVERIAGRRAAEPLRAPFSLGEASALRAMVAEAEFASVDVSTVQGIGTFPSVRVLLEADLRGWLPLMGIVLPEKQIAQILTEGEQALAAYVSDDGRVRFPLSAHLVRGLKAA